jgi:ankyrin repeat protein
MTSAEQEMIDAADRGKFEKVEALSRDHPSLDVNWKDQHGWTALHYASYRGHLEGVKLLLVHPHINVNAQTTSGGTPLYIACAYNSISIIKLLLKDPRVDITMATNYGCTPLWIASWEGYYDIIELLIASGRDLGDLNQKGKTWGRADFTAREIGRRNDRTEVVSLLERFVANPELTRYHLRVKLRLFNELAAEFFALIVFVCDDLLKLKPASSFTSKTFPALRFFTVATKLPMELQMILCCRSIGSMKQNILRKDSELAFKFLAKTLLVSHDQ